MGVYGKAPEGQEMLTKIVSDHFSKDPCNNSMGTGPTQDVSDVFNPLVPW
jgi:hypothetical protein